MNLIPNLPIKEVADSVAGGVDELAKNVSGGVGTLAKNVSGGVDAVVNKAQEIQGAVTDEVVKNVDVNGDGQVDIEDMIILAFKVPGVSVERDSFLRKELGTRYPDDVIDKVVETTPMKAGIASEDIEEIVDAIIQGERLKVSGISAALGAPGGAAMAATIPADMAQYYGCLLRTTQKLLYLYGFPQIEYEEKEQILDSTTMNQIILCLGVMFGVANAKNGLLTVAKALGKGVEKQLIKKALTKGTIYPIVKSVSKWFGVKMTKEVFAGFFKKAIPVVGGVVGGGLTFLSFGPCCDQLKSVLRDTYLSNPDYNEDEDEIIVIEDESEDK